MAPDIDGVVYLSGAEVRAGEFVEVEITQSADYDLVGEVVLDDGSVREPAPKPARKVGLRVVS